MTLFKSWGFLGSDYPGVGGGTPIFVYTLYIKVRSIIIGSTFQKSNTFGSMKICGYIYIFFFGGGEGGWGGVGVTFRSLRNRSIFCIFCIFFFFFFFLGGGGERGSFLYIKGLFKVKIQNGNIFWAAKFQTYLGMPDIPDFFFFFFFFWGGGVGDKQ